jgi:hypothetical protein
VGTEKSYGALERKTEGFDGRGKMDLEQKKINSIKRDLKTNFFIELFLPHLIIETKILFLSHYVNSRK